MPYRFLLLLVLVAMMAGCQEYRQPPGTTDLLIALHLDRQLLERLSTDQYGERYLFQEGAGLQLTSTEVFLRAIPDKRQLRVQERELSWGDNEVSVYFPPGTRVLLQLRAYGAQRVMLDLGETMIEDAPSQALIIDLADIYQRWRQQALRDRTEEASP